MFTPLDWSIIASYVVLVFLVGVWMTRRAGKGLDAYFLADRSLPWWWLGTSIVATTFAADTPLAITGLTAKGGISANWFWWSWALTWVTITVFFASKWRKSQVLTDVEVIELRYDGAAAKGLRIFKAFFLSIIINCVIMGWVFKAMNKITTPFIQWKGFLGEASYAQLANAWPSFLMFENIDNTLTILVIFAVVVIYSSLGGIRGVIITDLFQFFLAITMAIIFAVYAVQYVGGLDNMYVELEEMYPNESQNMLSFLPAIGENPSGFILPSLTFLLYMCVFWWGRHDSDGSGFMAQRINTAKTPADAQKGSLWFTLAFFALRTWPWIIVALVTMIVFPLDDPARLHELGGEMMQGGEIDREMGYPLLMKHILPAGLLGLMFTSLLAAFMSTADTHINWGASYIVNDVYKRFLKPEATAKELIWVSRISVVAISLVAIIIASQMTSIAEAWKFFLAISSGLGIAHILRWIWWRANAWTEISGMATALILSLSLYSMYPDANGDYLVAVIAITSGIVAIIVTLITPASKDETLNTFIARVKPVGFWRGKVDYADSMQKFKRQGLMWVLALVTTYSAMFSIGHFLKLNWGTGIALLGLFLVTLFPLIKMIDTDE